MDRCAGCPRRIKPRCSACGGSMLSSCPCCVVPPRASCEEDRTLFDLTLEYLPDGFHVKAAHILNTPTSACRTLPVVKNGLALSEAVHTIKAIEAIGGRCSVSPDMLTEYPMILTCPLRRKLILNM